MVILLFSPIVLVFILVNFYPCENHFVFNAWACGSACYVIDPIMGIAIWVYSILAPITIMIISSILLITRVIYQKQKMVQRNIWRQNKKMIVQLFCVTGMVYASWLPITITALINMIHSDAIVYEIQARWLLIGLMYVDVLFSPFASIMAIPELRHEIVRCYNRWKQRPAMNRVLPAILVRTQTH